MSKEAAIAAVALGFAVLSGAVTSIWQLRSYLEARDTAFALEQRAIHAQLQLIEFRLNALEENNGELHLRDRITASPLRSAATD